MCFSSDAPGHNRAFHWKFAWDRWDDRMRMRDKLKEFDLAYLDYWLTCNQVHLLVHAREKQ